MSLTRIAAALALLVVAVPALRASTITYQMTFTSDGYTGTGTLTVDSAPANSGTTTYTLANQQLHGLTFTIGSHTFDFSADPSASVQFVDGQISKMNFSQAAGQSPASYTVEFANGFSLYGSNLDQPLVSGSFDITPPHDDTRSTQSATSPTPEPRSLLLLATALLGGGYLFFRRRRAAHS